MYCINDAIVSYDKIKRCDMVDPYKLVKLNGCGVPFRYSVTDEMIACALKSERYIDTLKEKNHHGKSPEHHAQRIASLVSLILDHVVLDLVNIYSDSMIDYIEIEDGYHRIRSYLFIKEYINKDILMPVNVIYT